MSTAQLRGIDHLIIGVRDLEAARGGWERLGFTTTPRGRHVGWGTANYCIMFERDYLELLGVIDPTQFTNGIDRMVEKREGLTGVVFHSTDPAATAAAWRTAGLAPDGPKDLGRVLEAANGTDLMLRFANVYPAAERTAGVSFFACHHLTPAPMRTPAWLEHPNGAEGIRSVTWLVPDPAPVAEVMARVFGKGAITWTDNVAAVHTGHGRLLFATADDVGMLHPRLAGLDVPEAPVPVALGIAVADKAKAAAALQNRGVPFSRDAAGGITVDPAEATGVLVEFN